MCIPFAGAGAGVYRPWTRRPATALRIVPVQLPGREELFDELPYPSLREGARDLAARIGEAPPRPFALFGHSFGAVLAYETARRLHEDGGPLPVRLIVSGAAAPRPAPRADRITHLPDEQFIDRLADHVGYQHVALDDPDLRELLLPTLRADLALHETYDPGPAEPLPIPLTVVRGAADRIVAADACRDWAERTAGEFGMVDLPGGHMYLLDDWEALSRTLEGLLG